MNGLSSDRNYACAGTVQTKISGRSAVVSELARILTVFLATIVCLHFSIAGAQTTSTFPGVPIDSRALRVQDQAEKVYQRTDYERAFFIYRNELAPTGDKYGQYMVGFMYLAGKGVPEDRVAASAWYRLAAERGIKEFDKARDRLMVTLDDAQKARSDLLFIQLRKQYGDLALLIKAAKADYKLLGARTGSRLSSSGGSPLTIVRPNGGVQSGADYYDQIERRMQSRLEYIARHTKIEITDSGIDNVDLASIEEQINEQLDTLD